MRTLFRETGAEMGISAIFGVVLAGVVLLAPPPAHAEEGSLLVAVVRGAPPRADAKVVALCPDLTDQPEVFLARGEQSLADRLARAGYRVYLVDPWASKIAASGGFDAVIDTVYPSLVNDLKKAAGGGRVTWIGHGLCGFLPIAAAAVGGQEGHTGVDWVGLGSRLDWTHVSPLFRDWLTAWATGETPVPLHSQQILFSGLRGALGPRPSSVPTALQSRKGGSAGAQLESYHRTNLARPPALAVLADLIRWFDRGRPIASKGWLDYTLGLERVTGRGLLLLPASSPVGPPESVLEATSSFSASVDVATVLLSREQGMSEDYGHLGMILSTNASADVDRLLLRWLAGQGPHQ